jgi:hypothetical protein
MLYLQVRARLFVVKMLQRRRDVSFDSKSHTYQLHGAETKYPVISVTTFIKNFFPQFDSMAKAQEMVGRSDFKHKHTLNPDSLLAGCSTAEEVTQRWYQHGVETAKHGTMVHEAIRATLDPSFPVKPAKNIPEMEVFNNRKDSWFRHMLKRTHLGEMKDVLFQCEFPLGDDNSMVCGTPDLIIWNPTTRKFIVVDWKTGKKALDECSYAKQGEPEPMGFSPCEELVNTQRSKTCLQLGLYSRLGELACQMECVGMFVVQINMELVGPKYAVYRVPVSFSSLAQKMLDHRAQQIEDELLVAMVI